MLRHIAVCLLWFFVATIGLATTTAATASSCSMHKTLSNCSGHHKPTGCYWLNNTCVPNCNNYQNTTCPSYCWTTKTRDAETGELIPGCAPNCHQTSSYAECDLLGLGCSWNRYKGQCMAWCENYFGYDCPNATAMGKQQPSYDACMLIPSTGSSSQCRRNCSALTNLNGCDSEPSCQWYQGACRLNCDQYTHTNSCPSYCWVSPVPSTKMCYNHCNQAASEIECIDFRNCRWNSRTNRCTLQCVQFNDVSQHHHHGSPAAIGRHMHTNRHHHFPHLP